MVFINGEIRPLGYNVLNNILKLAVSQPSFSLEQLIVLYKTFASTPAEFVGYAGANFLWATYQSIEAVINKSVATNDNAEVAREDFTAMISAFAQYVNLLNAENLHSFPWRHDVEYPLVSN
jgi:hypothetical protein